MPCVHGLSPACEACVRFVRELRRGLGSYSKPSPAALPQPAVQVLATSERSETDLGARVLNPAREASEFYERRAERIEREYLPSYGRAA